MNNKTITISDITDTDIEFILRGNDTDELRSQLIERLVSKESNIVYEIYLMHDMQDDFICQHKWMELTDDGLYKCDVCDMKFEMQIPF